VPTIENKNLVNLLQALRSTSNTAETCQETK